MNKKQNKTSILGFNKVEVLGHEFDIVETHITDELLLDNSLCYGIAKPVESKIIISTRQSETQMQVTFFHELLHVIDWILHNEQFEYDEVVINTLARGLATVKLN